ncbi:MAG: hypothetical protein KatS3mg131_1999 [Candidatus Tectimicrobiota bacterium]|nr:MAG: hypothetical protein KatS3mg131_1999 [Candidatus Tectomicrobia bacterium]
MGWTHYTLSFRLLSPLHVGHRRMGNLMQTKPYVPGKPLWAALTTRLTRDRNRSNAPGREDYRRVGEALMKYFRFGYLWPSLDGKSPCFPWAHEAFEYTFLGSYMSTALDYGRQAAEEGALHEVEFLSPYTPEGRPVFLVGDLWVREEALSAENADNQEKEELKAWREALGRIQLGGERNYGWGRVRLLSDLKEGRLERGHTVTGFRWEVHNEEVVLRLPEGSRLPAHSLIADGTIEGPVEVLNGWEHKLEASERRWQLAEAKPAYAPGTRVVKQGELPLVVRPWGWLASP